MLTLIKYLLNNIENKGKIHGLFAKNSLLRYCYITRFIIKDI